MKAIHIIKTCFVICFLLSNSIFSQETEETVLYDFEIDYYPQIQSIRTDTSRSLRSTIDGGFEETIEMLLRRNFSGDIFIERFSGREMSLSGVYPKALEESLMWFSIGINEDGQVFKLNVNGYSKGKNEQVDSLLSSLFIDARIKPALKAGIPVQCKLYYMVRFRRARSNYFANDYVLDQERLKNMDYMNIPLKIDCGSINGTNLEQRICLNLEFQKIDSLLNDLFNSDIERIENTTLQNTQLVRHHIWMQDRRWQSQLASREMQGHIKGITYLSCMINITKQRLTELGYLINDK